MTDDCTITISEYKQAQCSNLESAKNAVQAVLWKGHGKLDSCYVNL